MRSDDPPTSTAEPRGARAGVSRIVIVGGGFAGFHAARSLSRIMGSSAEVTLINPTDYFLYLPLLPEVATGILDPRRICVSLPRTLPRVRLELGSVDGIDLDGRRVSWIDAEDERGSMSYDRLILAAGSVNKLLPIPGAAKYAHGFRGVPEALYLRDHLTRQVELAAATENPDEREQRCTFVVVGAGYTGTEVAAQGPLYTADLARNLPALRGQRMRWMLLDLAPRLLPELDRRLSDTAERVLRRRGVEVRTGQSIEEAKRHSVRLTTGEDVPTRSLIWCVGVRPDPIADELGRPLKQGRLVVDEYLSLPDYPDVLACGDIAAVPDLTRPPGELTAMTAQHAERQGKLAARNCAASLGVGARRPYRHRDLGFLVDLGGTDAAANPLNVPLSGLLAKAVTRGYHLFSMPGNRIRTASDWILDATLSTQTVQLGLVRSAAVPLDTDSAALAHYG